MENQNNQDQNEIVVFKDSQIINQQFMVSQSQIQLEQMFTEIHQVINLCLQAQTYGPDVINFPDSKQHWDIIKNGLQQLVTQNQIQYAQLQRGLSHLQSAESLSKKINDQLFSQDNPIETVQLYLGDSQMISENTKQALEVFNKVEEQIMHHWNEQMEKLSCIIGSEQANSLDQVLRQQMTKIKKFQDEITEEYSRNDIFEERMKLAVILGNIKESESLIESYQQQIKQNKQQQSQYETIKSQMENKLNQSEQDLVKSVNDIQKQTQNFLQNLNYRSNQKKEQLDNQKQQYQNSVNNKRIQLNHNIQNPKMHTYTTQHSKTTGFLFWKKTNYWTETHTVFEDVSTFRKDLETLAQAEAQQTKKLQQELEYESQNLRNQQQQAQEQQKIMTDLASKGADQIRQTYQREIQRHSENVTKIQQTLNLLTEKNSGQQNILQNQKEQESGKRKHVDQLEKDQQDRLNQLKKDLELAQSEYDKSIQRKDEMLKQLGYHSLSSLYESLKMIEHVVQGVNNRKIILSKQINYVSYFKQVIDSSVNIIPICAEDYKKSQLEIKAYPIQQLEELDENIENKKIQNLMNLLKNNKEALEEIKGSELYYLNLISNLDETDEIWNELGIEKKLTRKVLIRSIVDLKRQMMLLKKKNQLNDRLKKEFGQLEQLFKQKVIQQQQQANNNNKYLDQID